ncbi:MAG: putative glycoside hydrolase [Acutalibacteraceae bacterium]
MAFKKPNKKNSDKKVRVKNSYYSFSKEYPGGFIGNPGRKAQKKARKRSILLTLSAVICFVLIFCLSFFVSELGLRFSYKQPTQTELTEESSESSMDGQTNNEEPIKALYMPSQKLSDTGYIKDLIRNIKRKDFNSVVIDFKTEDGNLSFFSNSQIALLAKCSSFDNETVEKAIELFEKYNIKIIARIFCFEDATVSSSNPELAVKYMNSDVLWLDKPEAEGGKSRLNPYSTEAQEYIIDVIKQVSGFGISDFLLEEVDFPDGDASDTAGFPGEKKKSDRGKVLVEFVNEVNKSLPASSKLMLGFTADDLLSDGSYSNLLVDSDINSVCADSFVRPDTYVVDKKADYSSMLSLFTSLNQKTGQSKQLVIQLDFSEYSWRYVKALKNSGYENIIVFDESGKY